MGLLRKLGLKGREEKSPKEQEPILSYHEKVNTEAKS